jgi:hypothetical protein
MIPIPESKFSLVETKDEKFFSDGEGVQNIFLSRSGLKKAALTHVNLFPFIDARIYYILHCSLSFSDAP